MASDGKGGVLAAWVSESTESSRYGRHIRCQRLDERGVPLWYSSESGGLLVAAPVGEKHTPQLVADGTGGAILVWLQRSDFQDQNGSIVAQRIDAAGSAVWGEAGLTVAHDSADPHNAPAPVRAASDGSGGILIVWADDRHEPSTAYGRESMVQAQRISAAGQLLWGTEGLTISEDASVFPKPCVVSDGSGGGIFAWAGPNNAHTGRLLRAQRVGAEGNTIWVPGGFILDSSTISNEVSAQILGTSDESGRAIFAYSIVESVGPDPKMQRLAASRIAPDGILLWPENHVLDVSQSVVYPLAIIGDGNQGAILAYRLETEIIGDYSDTEVFVTRLHGGAQLWDRKLPTADTRITERGRNATLAPDGAGGAIVAWKHESAPYMPGRESQEVRRLGPEGQTIWTDSDLPYMQAVAAAQGGRAVGAWKSGNSLFASLLPPWSFLSHKRQLKIQVDGAAFQELFYNYATNELTVSPYFVSESSVPYQQPFRQPFGIFHYDFGSARFAGAVYIQGQEF